MDCHPPTQGAASLHLVGCPFSVHQAGGGFTWVHLLASSQALVWGISPYFLSPWGTEPGGGGRWGPLSTLSTHHVPTVSRPGPRLPLYPPSFPPRCVPCQLLPVSTCLAPPLSPIVGSNCSLWCKCLEEGVLFPGRPLTDGHSYQYRRPVPEPSGPYSWLRTAASDPTVQLPKWPHSPAELVPQSVRPPLPRPVLTWERSPAPASSTQTSISMAQGQGAERSHRGKGSSNGAGNVGDPYITETRDPAHGSWEQTPTRPTAWEPAVPPGCPRSSPRPPWPPHPSEVIFHPAHARWKNRPGHLAAKPGGPLGGGAVGTRPDGNLKQKVLLGGRQGTGLWGPSRAPLREWPRPSQEYP